MKILHVDFEFDYGNPKRGKNLIGEMGFKQSMIALGHEVISFYWDKYLHDVDSLQKALLLKAEEIKPDLIFFMLFQDQFKKETLLKLKSQFHTVNWFGDDSWRFDNFTKDYANLFTTCITTDKFSVDKYHALGQQRVINSQWAVIPTQPPKNLNIKYEYDVSFVGGFNYTRDWFVKTLQSKGIKVATFGFGWENGPISLEKMNDIFLKSKINLNLSNSKCYDIRYVLSHPIYLAHTIKTKKNASQIKARHFEINYNGGFQLADYSAGLEDYFNLGKELVCYRDIDEAILLINYYLKHSDEREEIKNKGFLRACNEHTYIHRFKEIFEQILK